MRRPSFQFYPADWRNNAKLRRCSWAARGAWIEIMGLLHDSDDYGLLTWPLKEIAQALGCPLSLLRELADKGVLKGCDKGVAPTFTYTPMSGRKPGPTVTFIESREGPIWYCSRMVRDEYVRQKKANFELYKDSPNRAPQSSPDQAPNLSPMPPIGEGIDATPEPPNSDLPTSSSSSSLKTKELKPLSGGPDVAEVLDYLNLKAGRAYQHVDANLKLIAGRLVGSTVDQCKAVIDARVAKWLGDKTMDEYLRPKTLFNATNFAQYVGELGASKTAGIDGQKQDPRFAGCR